MTTTSRTFAWNPSRFTRCFAPLIVFSLVVLGAGGAAAWTEGQDPYVDVYAPRGVTELDGDFVINVGELHICVSNIGLIGSMFSSNQTFSHAPSAQWPAGSGNEYLWGAGFWFGGVVLGETLVSTSFNINFELEMRPLEDVEYTIYEAIGSLQTRPAVSNEASGRRDPDTNPDDDDDGVEDEETLNGFDDDVDGMIDEDFGQIGNQSLTFTVFDNTSLAQELYPDHTPLNIQVVQEAFGWENDAVDDFVGFQYTITNIGVTDIRNVYIGFFADSDIGPRGGTGVAADDMAGRWSGLWLASDGSYVPVSVGYMYDAAEGARIDGYYGVLFLNHDIDPTGRTAPQSVRMRSFQTFTGQQPFDNGGDPTNDAEQYELMSDDDWDDNTRPGRENDFRFMVSAGPFALMEPDETLRFQVAMVVGQGLTGLLNNCAEAWLTWQGNFFDRMADQAAEGEITPSIGSGVDGRETLLCREDFDDGSSDNPFDNFRPNLMDTTCVREEYVLEQPPIADDEIFFWQPDPTVPGKHCAFFNLDNCFECARQNGFLWSSEDVDRTQVGCNRENLFIETDWNCWDPDVSDDEKIGCTGLGGFETQIHWLVGMAPPPPGIRLVPRDNRIHVFWDDLSEKTADIRLQAIDFESYRIWRADNWERPFGSSLANGPESNLWQLLAEFDIDNTYTTFLDSAGTPIPVEQELGANTTLEAVKYTPVVLADPQFSGLDTLMQAFVDDNPDLDVMPTIRDARGDIRISPDMTTFVRYETYPDVLDTFFAVTERTVESDTPKVATNYYEYIDYDVHNGFIYFYSVTATDHLMGYGDSEADGLLTLGAGQSGDPSSSFLDVVPGAKAQTPEERKQFGANIYVYPNPATRDALELFQQLNPNEDDPTGVRVEFANLPAAVNTIRIWTLSGDWVQTVDHDGTYGVGRASWNLVSRNGQEVVSGVYLYTVESADAEFEDFVGKFVVVR